MCPLPLVLRISSYRTNRHDGTNSRKSFTRSTCRSLPTKRFMETYLVLVRRELDRPPIAHVWSRVGFPSRQA
jgi:hypothetical protein